MELKDFKIGKRFYTATGKWIVADVGTRTMVARRDAERIWDDANNEIFYWYDFKGCTPRPQRYQSYVQRKYRRGIEAADRGEGMLHNQKILQSKGFLFRRRSFRH